MALQINYLDKYIENKLLAEDKEREENRESSGKLSAGRLGQPLQWQMLHALGVPKDPLTEYVIRKFRRGNHVEDWLRGLMPGIINREKFVEYRDVVGYVDAIVDMKEWGNVDVNDCIPHEIKSTANSVFKWIEKGGYKKGHALQATLYAMALGTDHFVINYVASDDYRILSFLVETKTYVDEVDKIIDTYNKQVKIGVVPGFEPIESWQAKKEYNSYSEFADLKPMEIEVLLKTKYPEQYKKLKENK